MKVPVIEHQIYICSACKHIARRLAFRRAEVPITHWPVTPISVDTLWKERIAARGTWRNGSRRCAADRSTSKREQQQRRLSAGRRQLRRSAASKRLLRNSSLYPSNRLARPVANVRARQVADLTVCEHSPASRDRTPSQSRSTIDRIWSLAGRNRARSLLPNRPSQAMNTEKTNGESTPPAITSFSPVRSGASSPRK